MALNINKLGWGEPIAHDGRYYRLTPLPDNFWEEWRDDKKFLRKKGIVPFERDGEWRLALWTDRPELPDTPSNPFGGELPALPPIESTLGGITLFEPQIPHVQHLVRALRIGNVAVDTSDVGTGKTYCGILAAHNVGLTPVVVCPKTVVPAWREAGELAGVRIEVINYEMAIRGNWGFVERTKTKRPAYMQFEWKFKTPEKYLVIFDEGHRLKGEESLTSCLLSSLKRSGAKALILSATLIENPMDMKSLGYAMGFHHWSNWQDFLKSSGCFTVKQKCFKWIRPAGRKPYKTSFDVNRWLYKGGKRGMKALHSKIFPALGHGLLKSDMKGLFPDNLIMPLNVDIGKVEGIFKAMRRELRDLEMKRKRDIHTSDSKLTIMLRAQQEAELVKVPSVVEMAKDLEQEGNSVVVFAHFRETLDAIQAKLEGEVINGDQNGKQRDEAVKRFQTDTSHFMVAQYQAGGTGVNLHQKTPDKRPRASILIPNFDGRLFGQALGRIHRAKATDTVRQYIVFDAKSPTDQRVCKAIESKTGNINAFNGDFVEDLVIIEDNQEKIQL